MISKEEYIEACIDVANEVKHLSKRQIPFAVSKIDWFMEMNIGANGCIKKFGEKWCNKTFGKILKQVKERNHEKDL
jgi:hypothetical protein